MDDEKVDNSADETPEVEPETPETDPETDAENQEPLDTDESFNPDKAREKIRKVNSENKNLRDRAKQAEEKAKNADEVGEKLTALEAENLRLRVAVKLKGELPDDLIERLRGDTEEELLEDAEKLLGYFEKQKPPTNQPRQRLRGGSDPTKETAPEDWDKFAEDIFND